MHKVLRRQPWTYVGCLQQTQSRLQSSAATAVAQEIPTYQDTYISGSPKLRTDDNLLRNVFNNQSFWRDFSSQAKTSGGLIGNKHLTTPRGFQRFAETALHKCRQLVDRTLKASTAEELRAIPRDLDQLSDLLCRVIDLSDFTRSVHPDQQVAAAATASYSMMYQYMNELNTTIGLNQQLRKAWDMPEVHSQWTEEEKVVAVILMKDFAKSGVDLPDAQRHEFVSLSNEIASIGTEFIHGIDHASDFVPVSKSQLAGVDPRLAQSLSSWRKAQIPVQSTAAKLVMSTAHDSDVKRNIYIAERRASNKTLARLENLLLQRAKLAKLTGYDSYAQMSLADKMAKSPEAVNNFLLALNQSNKTQVQKELDQLLSIKRLNDPGATNVGAWEHRYLLNGLRQRSAAERTSKSRLWESANHYFAIGHVIQGLSSLFESLYGVRLVPQETKIGEVWHPDVRRLDVYTESNEHIATMYCDLFSRAGKLPNPAHFTLLCSREISEEEVQESRDQHEPLNMGMPVSTEIDTGSGRATHYQIPVIALVCDFHENNGGVTPTTLTPSSVTTLFHEMGHAVHSILGRTSMQGIAGTRCATDFAELPSVLMEYFAKDPAVLKLFARHWQSGQVIPDELIEAMRQDKQASADTTGGWDNETQILMAMLDQTYHAEGPVEALALGRYNSTSNFHHVWNQHGSVEEPWGTSWQGFFGHLYGYGATYYSYLFDRAIARQVWRAVFKDGVDDAAINRVAGERFKQEVLRWGGGRDPWKCLEGLMGEGKGVLAEGGSEAMNLVGQWGVGAGSEGQM